MFTVLMARLRYALSPKSDFGKLLRDASVLFAATILGYIIEHWTDLVSRITEDTNGLVPGFVFAMFYALALYIMRYLRSRMP